MAFTARELLARIIKCEAGGEGDSGMRAVATVIMNRVNIDRGEYLRVGQGNLQNVIYQAYQFDCAREIVAGRSNTQNIFNIPAEPVHFAIADWSLGGGLLNEVGICLWYMNPYGTCEAEFPRNGNGTFHTRINNHCFYRPTPSYSLT